MRLLATDATGSVRSAFLEEPPSHWLDLVSLAQSGHGDSAHFRNNSRGAGQDGCGRPCQMISPLCRRRPVRIKRNDRQALRMGHLEPSLLSGLGSMKQVDAEDSTNVFARPTGWRGPSA